MSATPDAPRPHRPARADRRREGRPDRPRRRRPEPARPDQRARPVRAAQARPSGWSSRPPGPGSAPLGAVNRQFARAGAQARHAHPGARRRRAPGSFDLTPTEDEQMLVDVVTEFAAEVVRPAAAEADDAAARPGGGAQGQPRDRAADPRRPRGARRHLHRAVRDGRHPGRRGARARRHGPGRRRPSRPARSAPRCPCGAPTSSRRPTSRPSPATTCRPPRWRSPSRGRCSTRSRRATTAVADGDGFVLNGVKSMVPRGADAELFVVGAELDGEPRLFLVESGTPGSTIEAEPSMGLRAASLSRLVLDGRPGRATSRPLGDDRRLRRVRAAVPAGLVRAVARHGAGGARLRHPLRQRARGVRRADQPPAERSRSWSPTSASSCRACGW